MLIFNIKADNTSQEIIYLWKRLFLNKPGTLRINKPGTLETKQDFESGNEVKLSL
jgi:hypothetical protein